MSSQNETGGTELTEEDLATAREVMLENETNGYYLVAGTEEAREAWIKAFPGIPVYLSGEVSHV